ncbi:MAG TPA: hypothetical protein VLG69_04780 [Candidatus Andersenbacteria bacterium]|nr:hypothetical protein [Candidatus Andersenbacteria bacterium]
MYGRTEVGEARIRGSAVQDLIRSWPPNSRKLAQALIRSYGMPHEATQSLLVWHYNGLWKRTILHRTGVPHNIPHPHTDLLEQTVDAMIPSDKYNDIIAFDGSILIDKTRGEMTAFCENEEANRLILNLAHDIAIDKTTPKAARTFMNKFEGPIHAHWPNPYRDSLQFTSTVLANNQDTMVTEQPN